MNHTESIKYTVICASMFLLSACAGTPKVSTWTSPPTFTLKQVYDAALVAGTDNGFTVYNQDRPSGLISLKKETYAGEKMADRRMSVKIKPNGNKIAVSTKVSGSNVGIIEGALGGAVHKEITNNFYVYLFRELKITDPKLRNITVEDEH